MTRLLVPEPISGGLLLSYKCNSKCRHCMYACSPRWKADWIDRKEAEKVLVQLTNAFNRKYPPGYSGVGVNVGLHFTGGEPFLNYDLLLDLTETARNLQMPSLFVETNCFWSTDNETTKEKLEELRDAGLCGILISVNPFVLEYVPFERTLRTISMSRKVFGGNVMVYQELFFRQFRSLGIKATLSFEEYLQKAGSESLSHVELIPMGRACYELGHFYQKNPAETYFNSSCKEELTRSWHIHVDNYYNYMTGYCGGITLGDARHLDEICKGLELDDHPILAKLVAPNGMEKLFKLGKKEYGYKQLKDGYVSKCHLCLDIRKHITKKTHEYKELKPLHLYEQIDHQNQNALLNRDAVSS